MHRPACALLAFFLTAQPLLAHPGHGTTASESATHYLVEPVHIGPVVIVVAAVAAGLWLRRRLARLKTSAVRSEIIRRD